MRNYKALYFICRENEITHDVTKYELEVYCIDLSSKRLKGMVTSFIFFQKLNRKKVSKIKIEKDILDKFDFVCLEDGDYGIPYRLKKHERIVFREDDIRNLVIRSKYFTLDVKNRVFNKIRTTEEW